MKRHPDHLRAGTKQVRSHPELFRRLQIGDFQNAVDFAVDPRRGNDQGARLHPSQSRPDRQIVLVQRAQDAGLPLLCRLSDETAADRQNRCRLSRQCACADAQQLPVLHPVEDTGHAMGVFDQGGKRIGADFLGLLRAGDSPGNQCLAPLEPGQAFNLAPSGDEPRADESHHPDRDRSKCPVDQDDVGYGVIPSHEIAQTQQERTGKGRYEGRTGMAHEQAQRHRYHVESPFCVAHRGEDVGYENQGDQQCRDGQEETGFLGVHRVRNMETAGGRVGTRKRRTRSGPHGVRAQSGHRSDVRRGYFNPRRHDPKRRRVHREDVPGRVVSHGQGLRNRKLKPITQAREAAQPPNTSDGK